MIQVGFWRRSENSGEQLPWPLVQKLPEAIKQKVISYLEYGEKCNQQKGWSNCRLCGCHNGSFERNDGEFVWPEGYVHYIRDHDVKIDDDLLMKILTTK